MRVLIDTHIFLWALGSSRKLPPDVRGLLSDPRNVILYSAASVWEIAIKTGLGRKDFRVELPALLRAASETGFMELPVTGAHAARLATLPDLHRDPFDRLLVAQALSESVTLLTNDEQLRAYGTSVRVI